MSLKPIGKNIVLQISEEQTEAKTSSGIFLPSSEKEDKEIAKIVAIGNDILNDEKTKDVLSVGDEVIYSKYSGNKVEIDDEEFLIVEYKDILCVVE